MAKGKKKPAQAQARERARAAAKAEAERIKAAQAAKERRTRLLTLGGLAAVLVVVAIIVIAVLASQGGGDVAGVGSKPAGARDNGAVRLGQDLVPGSPAPDNRDVVTVAIYTDFMCPLCGTFERNYSAQLAEMSREGIIQIDMHTLAFLDGVANAEEYSTRSAKAAAAVAKYDPASYWAFQGALFEDQPPEGQGTFTDEQIADIARNAGVSEEAIAKLTDPELDDWVSFATEQAFKTGITGTPSIMMGKGDGEMQRFTAHRAIGFEQGVANVLAGLPPDGE